MTTSVTETPVETDVSLHSEKVKVQRRAVDRPVTDADAAFRAGTIEMKETAEQAVVNKRARVVEEIVLSKEGSDTTQTVKDKVRKTNVDVQNVATPTKVTHETYESFKPVAEAHHKANYASQGISPRRVHPRLPLRPHPRHRRPLQHRRLGHRRARSPQALGSQERRHLGRVQGSRPPRLGQSSAASPELRRESS